MADRILIADDDPGIASVLAAILEVEGYAVTRASDGAEALALCAGAGPDLLITDHMMPRLSGTALIALLRQRERGTRPAPRPLPIILMSAGGTVATIPPTVFLAKPFDLGHVVALVARMLVP